MPAEKHISVIDGSAIEVPVYRATHGTGKEAFRFARVIAIAIVDKEDSHVLSKRWWLAFTKSGYARSYIGRKTTYLHHAIIGKPIRPLVVSHLNGNPLDNRKVNLRFTTHADNMRNYNDGPRPARKNGGIRGISVIQQGRGRERWYGHVKIKYKLYVTSKFDTKEEAIEALMELRRKHGVSLNGIQEPENVSAS